MVTPMLGRAGAGPLRQAVRDTGRLTLAEARLKGNAGKHIITRAVGLRSTSRSTSSPCPCSPATACYSAPTASHAYLDSGATLTDLFKLNIHDAAPAAIRHANACGGTDNITALLVEFLAS